MVAPNIEIRSVSRYKIGRITNVDKSNVTFRYDQDLVQWEARADGQGVGQGLLVGSGVNASLLTLKQVSDTSPNLSDWISDFPNLVDVKYGDASFVVDDEELTNGDKPYRINVYGKNENGEWSAYG